MIFIVQFFLKLFSQGKKINNLRYPQLQCVAGIRSTRLCLEYVFCVCVYMLGLRESGGLFENRLTSIVDASLIATLVGCNKASTGCCSLQEKKKTKQKERKKSVMLNFWNTEDSLRKTLCSFLALCLQIFLQPKCSEIMF